MTTAVELRDSERARALLLQSLALARLAPRASPAWQQALRVAVELASHGAPLLPLGFLADAAHLLAAPAEAATLARPGLPEAFLDRVQPYEDYVLGKLYADASFERGAAALARYRGREQDQAMAFAVDALRQRAGLGGVLVSPAIVRGLLALGDEQFVPAIAASLANHGLLPELIEHYDALISGLRDVGELFGTADLFELEHRTAIAPAGERLALRQILAAREAVLLSVPARPPRRAARVHAVPTRLLDENAYPVGGFSSISTRGTIESLLHSQLAYMEPEGSARPDMFDIKFLRDELLYYARDENQFFRRRRTFVIALYPDLRAARLKDAGAPYQRVVLGLGLLIAAIERLIAWLGDESLTFRVLVIQDATNALAAEEALLRLLLQEQIANGTASVESAPPGAFPAACKEAERRTLCQAVTVAAHRRDIEIAGTSYLQLVLDRATPGLIEDGALWRSELTAMDAWSDTLLRLLELLR